MKNTLHKTVGLLGDRFTKIGSRILMLGAALLPTMAQAQEKLSWRGGGDSAIETWFNTILLVIMGVFVMTACIMGSLAFKQLAADGNWKDFWSKIAGAIGMFIVPIAIYWIRDQS